MHVVVPPSVFVTVRLRSPTVVDDEAVTTAVSCVELTNAVELTVSPVPDSDTAAPLTNPLPFTVTDRLLVPWITAPGFSELTAGAVLTITVVESEAAFPT